MTLMDRRGGEKESERRRLLIRPWVYQGEEDRNDVGARLYEREKATHGLSGMDQEKVIQTTKTINYTDELKIMLVIEKEIVNGTEAWHKDVKHSEEYAPDAERIIARHRRGHLSLGFAKLSLANDSIERVVEER